jgi:hypothetical protein
MRDEPRPLLHSVRGAARILGCGQSTLYAKFISPGLLDIARIGSATRITDASLRRLVDRLVAESHDSSLVLPESLRRTNKRGRPAAAAPKTARIDARRA